MTEEDLKNIKRMSNSELLLKQFKKKNKPGKNTKAELDSYNEFVDKISAGIMGPMGSVKGRAPKAFSKINTQKIMRRFGASPGKVKAVTGEAMADGGVVDLTTEMVIDE